MSSVTENDFKAAMASFGAGVTVITTLDAAGNPAGLTATAFSSVSKQPPLCLVCVARSADAYGALRASGLFAVNFLSREQENISNQFAVHGIDKFAGVEWKRGEATGCPVLAGTVGTVECTTFAVNEFGDHDVFIGKIERVAVFPAEPLLYFRGTYRTLTPG